MKKLRYLALLLAAAFAFSGCNAIRINPERDGAEVVAEVIGEKITKKQVYDAAGLTWDVKADGYKAEERKSRKTQALDSLIQEIVTKAKAKELGYYNFTTDEQKEIDDSLKSYRDSNYEKFLTDYKEKAKTDSSINPEEKANADIEEYKQQLIDNKAQQKAYEAATKDVAPSDEEVQTLYNSVLSEQKSQFDADPTQMSNYDTYAQFGYYAPIIYYPVDGFVRVKQILVALPDEVQKEIQTLRDEGKTEDADKKRDEELKKIEAKANEALTKAKEGGADLAKLSALITEYNEDSGMTAENPGYLVYPGSTNYMPAFKDAALKLTDLGKPSDLVVTDYGYHILWLTEKLAKGNVPLDQVKDKYTELSKASKQNEAWSTTVTGWVDALEKDKKIKTYENRLNIN